MDSINKTLNNLSLYEVKLYVRKAQNAVLSLTEMELKVREATNNEPWGAPSSLMQQIAAGTYNYREREEITNMIFRRFTEKSAHEWRQIYKALQLLEYIVKNGSEKFVDDARANVSIIQMLKSFHYIDSQGRDQGINVRNRSKQLILLLNDESAIRQERKKARQNQKKFGGVAGGKSSVNPNARFNSTFDDDDDDDVEGVGSTGFGGYQNRVFGDGGVYGERFEEERSASAAGGDLYEEYEVELSQNSRTSKPTTKTSNVTATANQDFDLLGLDAGPTVTAAATAAPAVEDDDDDDFDDFQSAAPTAQTTPAPTALNSTSLAGLFNASNTTYTPQLTSTLPQFNTFQQQQQQQLPTQTYSAPLPVPGPVPSLGGSSIGVTASKPKNDAFSSLFSTAKTSTHMSPKPARLTVSNNSTTDDDLFGSFASPTPLKSLQPLQPLQNDEVDLLSF